MGKYPYFPKVNSTWNKKQKFDSVSVKEITTPDNPDSDYEKLYFKSDGELYKLNSSGVESVVGGSSAGAGNNVIMQQDTTALNHTYSTTTTASTGETADLPVDEDKSNTNVEVTEYGTYRTLTSLSGNISGTLSWTTQTSGYSLYGGTLQILNTSGSVIYTGSHCGASSSVGTCSITFSGLVNASTVRIYCRGNGNNTTYCTNINFTGTRSEERNPDKMNSTSEDGSSATGYYASIETTNPFVKTDFGSSTRIASVAIMPRTQNTETIFQIQTSEDGSTWVTNRTILASSLTSWIYNYVKLTPVVARYVRIYGYSGASKVISFDEIKVKVGISDTSFLNAHYHKDISTTDTSLTLAGDSE